jgi:hypothetical protein
MNIETCCRGTLRTRFAAIGAWIAVFVPAATPAHADNGWDLSVLAEVGSPSGWVQVRENEIEGTRLHFDDLDVNTMPGLHFRADKTFSDVSELHLGFSTFMLDGNTTIDEPVNFNGATIAPGKLETRTRFQDFVEFDAAYWHRFAGFGQGGGIWGSIGATYVLLNFRLNGTLAPDSVGNELKEDFYVQELPVPMFGLHLRYPFANAWELDADASAGRLPWVDSLRTEGGEVKLAQTNEEVSVGLDYHLGNRWHAGGYLFYSYFAQDEKSHEDGNAIRLDSTGIGIKVGYQF